MGEVIARLSTDINWRSAQRRITHLCNVRIIEPFVDADGTGSFRQFTATNIDEIEIALSLMEAKVATSKIRNILKAYQNGETCFPHGRIHIVISK